MILILEKNYSTHSDSFEENNINRVIIYGETMRSIPIELMLSIIRMHHH